MWMEFTIPVHIAELRLKRIRDKLNLASDAAVFGQYLLPAVQFVAIITRYNMRGF